MKLIIIKALIAWLDRHYHFLLYEAVVKKGQHLHLNPRKKPKGLSETMRGRG